jgi:aryl-alcohol dehydrogenase-like predicted oxidoreductase
MTDGPVASMWSSAWFAGVASNSLHPPVNVQIGHSLLEPAGGGVLAACTGNDIGVTAYSPLAGGWLARDYRTDRPYPPAPA